MPLTLKFFLKSLSLFSVGILGGCETFHAPSSLNPLANLTKHQIEEKLLGVDPSLQRRPAPSLKKRNQTDEISSPFKAPVTLVTSDSIPLKDIFFQMARQARIDLSLDPAISGSAVLHVTNRPLIDVISEVCVLNHLRYKITKGLLRIEPDRPYLVNYNAQFLGLARHNQSRISVATDLFTASHGERGSSDNGSHTLLSGEAKNDFWSELESNLATILKNIQEKKTESDPPLYTLHKQAGIVSIYASESQHKEVENFLRMLRLSLSSQVLIEVKIVEVLLKDEFKTGINWNLLKGDLLFQASLGETFMPRTLKESSPRDIVTFGARGKELTDIINLMRKFGVVRTLSSPRLIAMNNEPGVMKIATNYVFFRIDYNRDYGYDTVREHEYVSSEVHTVPIGLIMVVHPSINMTTGDITLSLRPTISRIVEEKPDPAVAIVSKESHQSYVPVVRKQEFESLVSMRSGDFIVMGGFMEEISKNHRSDIPYLSDFLPANLLTNSTEEEHTISELVIFLKATLIESEGDRDPLVVEGVDPADLRLYKDFSLDPRPLETGKF